MNVFIFLFSGVDFLLFLLLATLEVASHVHIDALTQQLTEVGGVEVGSLANEAGVSGLAELKELLEG